MTSLEGSLPFEALILGAAFTVVTVKIKTVKKHTRQVLTRISILILSCSVRVSEAFIGQTLAPSSLRRAIAAATSVFSSKCSTYDVHGLRQNFLTPRFFECSEYFLRNFSKKKWCPGFRPPSHWAKIGLKIPIFKNFFFWNMWSPRFSYINYTAM